jgi:L-iditol 2-dehydrogenase
MKALTFKLNIPAYLLTGALSGIRPQVVFSSWVPVQMREIAEPKLPGPEWVTVKPRLSGFCGSDLGTVLCHESLTLEPFPSYPCVLGHEVCGDIVSAGEEVEGFSPGDRVTVMPALSCLQRRIEPFCRMCARGKYQLCENITEGSLAAGMYVGICKDTPGFISEMGVAHASQLYKIPDNVSDENAVLTEPFSVALHMVVANPIATGETVMVIGLGVMGLCTVAALKALHPDIRIIGVEVDPFHSEVAKDMGVEEVIKPGGKQFYKRVAEFTGAKMYNPTMAQPILMGGVDRVFDAVGSTSTVNSALRVLAGGGWYSLLGISKVKKIDWTPVWFKELTIRGIYAYQDEEVEGARVHDFDLALELFADGKVDLSHLVTHRFTLDEWHKALDTAMNKGREKAIKIAFTA